MEKLNLQINSLNFEHLALVNRISAILSKAILEGLFKGGDQLIESKLQEQFGISRSPIREAFRDLEKKGLVQIIPRRGTFVKRVTQQDIEDNFPVRAALEGLAARQAFRKITAADLSKMRKALQSMGKAVAREDGKLYMQSHIAFHETFIAACGNKVLTEIIKNLRMHSLWFRFSYKYYAEDFKKSLKVHEKIFDLFKSRTSSEQDIEFTVRWHIEVAYDRFMEFLKEQR